MAACRSAGKAWFKRPASHHHGAAKKFWPVKLSLRFQIPNSSLRSPDLQSYSTRRKFLPYAHARSGGMHAHGGAWMKLRTKESISRFGGNPAGQAESGRMSSYRGLLSASQSLTLYIPITVRITAPSCRPGRVQSSECLPGLHACRLRPAGATRNRFPLGTY
jgi:hypothetical protein